MTPEQPVTTESPTVAICRHCGRRAALFQRFCGYCGTELGQSAAAATETPVATAREDERGDRAIVRRSFELALLVARHDGASWPPVDGEVRRVNLHFTVVELDYGVKTSEVDQAAVVHEIHLTYTGRWGTWLGHVNAGGVLDEIGYLAQGAAAEL